MNRNKLLAQTFQGCCVFKNTWLRKHSSLQRRKKHSQPINSACQTCCDVVFVTVAVVVAFFICWAPFQVQRLYAIYGFSGEDTTATEILVYKVMTYASGLLYYLSTTINPILYNIMSLKFRQAFKVLEANLT